MAALRIRALLNLISFLLLPLGILPAQDPESTDAQIEELVRQIRRNMVEVEREIDRVEAESAQSAAATTQADLQKLIDSLKGRGNQITADIDTIVKNLKSSGGGGGGGSGKSDSQESSGQSQSRDRNQRENQGQNPQGGQPQGGGKEDNTGQDQAGGKNQQGQKKPEERQVELPVDWTMERWGQLPPELRQQLISRNFDAFTPSYLEDIKAYFKKIAERK
jgi:hypothetical protein